MSDLISRQAAIDAADKIIARDTSGNNAVVNAMIAWSVYISALPSAQPEPLTDKEQRIFLAAMGREEKVCEEVDKNYVREPYEDSLMQVCKEIIRKVKGALWT